MKNTSFSIFSEEVEEKKKFSYCFFCLINSQFPLYHDRLQYNNINNDINNSYFNFVANSVAVTKLKIRYICLHEV